MANDLRTLYALSQSALQQGDVLRAISVADQMLQVSQYAPQTCGWSASLRLDARQWQQAVDIAQVGLTKGRNGDLFGILGQAYLGQSELVLAEQAFREAIREQPEYAPWKFHLARILLREDRDFEAMELLREGVATLPDPICLTRLAQLQFEFGQPGAALPHVQKALESAPNDASAHTLAAKCLMELHRDEEADVHWRRARELNPESAEQIDLTRAKLLRELGRFQSAAAALEAILRNRPASAEAYALIAETRNADVLIPKLEALLQDERLRSPERMNLEYALGKAHEDAGKFEEAMLHYDRANAIGYEGALAGGGFNGERYAEMVRARKETFSRAVVGRQLRDSGAVDPIFIVGNLRSGTTLLDQILRRHPDVGSAGEQRFWPSVEQRAVDLGRRTVDREMLSEIRGTYVRLLQMFHGSAQYVVDKQPANLLLAGLLSVAFPEGRIICMHRQMIDNALSIWSTRIQTTASFVHHKGHLAFALRQHEELMRHWSEVIPPDRFMTVPYESLVTEPETWTRKVVEFCGLQWNKACLSPEGSEHRVVTPSLWQVRQPVYVTSVDRWKKFEPWLGEFSGLRPATA